MSEIRQGSLIENRYTADCQIGQGGAAVVYLCRHVSLGSEHAIKVSKRCSPTAARRVLAEGRAQAKLIHPNIVRVTDSCMVDGAPALVMEFVRGPSLATLLQRVRLTQGQIDDLARGIFGGVAAAHIEGIVHRDLKPANILIDVMRGNPVPKIADFGIVKTFDFPEQPSRRTRSGSTMGTPEYMSPEQIRNAREVDARADVFSIGAVLYELVTGVRCFHAPDLLTTFNRIADGEYRPILELAPDAPPRVVHAINAALEPDRDLRCQTIVDLAAMWFDGAVSQPYPWGDAYRRAVAGWTDGAFTPPPSDEEDPSISSMEPVAVVLSRPPSVLPVSFGDPTGRAEATCAQTAYIDDVVEADPVWLATQSAPWGAPRIWLAAGAIATALGMNAGLVGVALAFGLTDAPAPPPVLPTQTPIAALVGECTPPAEEAVATPAPVHAAPVDAEKPGPFKRLFDRSASKSAEGSGGKRDKAPVSKE